MKISKGFGLVGLFPIIFTKSFKIVELLTLDKSVYVVSIFKSLSKYFNWLTEQSSDVSLILVGV